jgi:hypothetical protein
VWITILWLTLQSSSPLVSWATQIFDTIIFYRYSRFLMLNYAFWSHLHTVIAWQRFGVPLLVDQLRETGDPWFLEDACWLDVGWRIQLVRMLF